MHTYHILLMILICHFQLFYTEADDIASARFRQYVKEKRFQLKDYGSYGLTQLLVTPVSKPEKV